MDFLKMHGLGNDFIMVDNMGGNYDSLDFASFAKKHCERSFGIGADGVLVISPSTSSDAKMRVINADGSEAEMCGNGIRCVAKYIIEKGAAESPVSIETLAGVMSVEQVDGSYKVDMGVPKVAAAATVNLGSSKSYDATLVDMGNPHCVIFVDSFDFPWQEEGREIEKNKMFPNRSNVEFVKVVSPEELDVKVWERGAGATLACGTGACASLAAAVANNKASGKANVNLKGGSLLVELSPDNHVFITGPAEKVFWGTLTL